ncbi:hypothetical protein Cgig2_013000 [Carnegiea gigantea]|uniref:Uncharacterized protein n=1 Tax=Carnegiea gigantea TaxID=171969 RepID=A0A9Q1QEP8_9CARY|nr:hypothetical protein Cgig2_013000 [Carnegiea gigantea]
MLNESLAEKGEASSKDERSEKTFEKPQEERESFQKSPTKLEMKERRKKAEQERRREEKNPTYKDEEADHNDNKKEGKEESRIPKIVKPILKRNKPLLKSEGNQRIEQKDAQSNAGAALKFSVTTFDVYVTLAMPIGGRKIMKRTKSSMDGDYDEGELQEELHHIFSELLFQQIEEPLLQQVHPEICQGHEPHRIPRLVLAPVMKEAVAELHSAHTEFVKLQLKQQPNKDDIGPSFSPTYVIAQPNSQ